MAFQKVGACRVIGSMLDDVENRVKSLAGHWAAETADRLILETLTIGNMSADYIGWLQNPEVSRYLETRHSAQTREGIAKFVEDMLASDKDLMMGIFLKEKKKHIGNIKLGSVNWRYGRADIGIIIGDMTCWGKGYGTEAINCLCRIAFDTIGLRRVEAGAYAGNKASIKSFLKADFRQEGVQRGRWIVDGKPEDGVLLARLSDREQN